MGELFPLRIQAMGGDDGPRARYLLGGFGRHERMERRPAALQKAPVSGLSF